MFASKLICPFKTSVCMYATIKKADPGIMGLGKGTKKKAKFGVAVPTKKEFDVETDANKLVNFVCGTNILKEGGEDVKIKPDSEYPDWLWTIRTEKPPPLEELDPNSMQYWKRIRKLGRRRINYLKGVKSF